MNVDVDFGGRHLHKEEHHRENGGRQDIAVGFGNRVLNETIADQASVDEDKNRIAIELLDLRLRNEAVQAELAEILWRGWSGLRGVIGRFGGGYRRRSRLTPPWWRLREANAFQWLQRRERDQ